MPRVLLCGKSLFVSCLQTILEKSQDLELQIEGRQPVRIRQHIVRWEPDVLILETELLKKAMFLSLLQEYPQMKLIGMDIEGNRLQIFSGMTSFEPTPEELLHVIER